MMRKQVVYVCVLLAGILVSAPGYGAEREEASVFAVQDRVFHKNHELALSLGYIADDDFYNVYPLGVGYTFNFTDHLSWEVARFQYMFSREKDLKGDLEDEFGVTPSQFTKPMYAIHSSVVLRPFYGKSAVYNRRILNHETFFLLGAGMIHYDRKRSFGGTGTENAVSICLGAGKTYFLNKHLSLSLDIRDYVNLKDDRTENTIFLGLSLGFRFNLLPRKTEADRTLDTLNDYIRMGDGHEL